MVLTRSASKPRDGSSKQAEPANNENIVSARDQIVLPAGRDQIELPVDRHQMELLGANGDNEFAVLIIATTAAAVTVPTSMYVVPLSTPLQSVPEPRPLWSCRDRFPSNEAIWRGPVSRPASSVPVSLPTTMAVSIDEQIATQRRGGAVARRLNMAPSTLSNHGIDALSVTTSNNSNISVAREPVLAPISEPLPLPNNLNAEEEELIAKIAQKKRVMELRRELAEQRPNAMATVPSALNDTHYERIRLDEIRPMIALFAGDSNYPVRKWFEQYEQIMNAFQAKDMCKLRIARMLMTGAAELFVQTRADTEWNTFREAVINEFHIVVNPSDIYLSLRRRPIRPEETAHQYVLAMQNIAMRGNIDDQELLRYVLYGLNDLQYPSIFAYVASARTMDELKKALPNYEDARRMARARAQRTEKPRARP